MYEPAVPRLALPLGKHLGQNVNADDADVLGGSADDLQPSQEEQIDYTNPDTVAAHVCKTTLAGMQNLWRSHAAAMDGRGREFAETVYALHSQAIRDVASMKVFELKPVLGVLNVFTSGVRESVLRIFQEMRGADDQFAQALYQTTRRAFSRNLREALDAKEAAVTEKVKVLRAQHDKVLETQRAAAAVSQAAALDAQRDSLVKVLKEENKRKLAQAVQAITNMALAGTLPGASTATGGPPGAQASLADPFGSLPSSMPNTARSMGASCQPVSGLEVLQALAGGGDDQDLGNVLARKELEAQLKASTEAVDILKAKVEELSIALQQERQDIDKWKDKWAQESTKTDGIKRECLQIVIKCEQRVSAIQAEHMAELSKRDFLLTRAKDTILHLEAAAGAGGSSTGTLVSTDGPLASGLGGVRNGSAGGMGAEGRLAGRRSVEPPSGSGTGVGGSAGGGPNPSNASPTQGTGQRSGQGGSPPHAAPVKRPSYLAMGGGVPPNSGAPPRPPMHI